MQITALLYYKVHDNTYLHDKVPTKFSASFLFLFSKSFLALYNQFWWNLIQNGGGPAPPIRDVKQNQLICGHKVNKLVISCQAELPRTLCIRGSSGQDVVPLNQALQIGTQWSSSWSLRSTLIYHMSAYSSGTFRASHTCVHHKHLGSLSLLEHH